MTIILNYHHIFYNFCNYCLKLLSRVHVLPSYAGGGVMGAEHFQRPTFFGVRGARPPHFEIVTPEIS